MRRTGRSDDRFTGLETALDYRFADSALLALALRHPSSTARKRSNQRLEFLGDRVLGLVIATMLYETFPDEEEGALAYRHSALVRQETLEAVARELSLGAYLERGPNETGIGNRPAVLADACEAVIGALYLDGGLEAAGRVVRRRWTEAMKSHRVPPRDAKTRLQEWTQSRALGLPAYRVVRAAGPDHAPLFEVAAMVSEIGTATGTGPTKRAAEQSAAGKLLERIEGARESEGAAS